MEKTLGLNCQSQNLAAPSSDLIFKSLACLKELADSQATAKIHLKTQHHYPLMDIAYFFKFIGTIYRHDSTTHLHAYHWDHDVSSGQHLPLNSTRIPHKSLRGHRPLGH